MGGFGVCIVKESDGVMLYCLVTLWFCGDVLRNKYPSVKTSI